MRVRLSQAAVVFVSRMPYHPMATQGDERMLCSPGAGYAIGRRLMAGNSAVKFHV